MTLRRLFAAASLASLAACSSTDTTTSTFGQHFGGVWVVTHAWPSGAVVGAPGPQGQSIALTAGTATDPLGRSCGEPAYTVSPGRAAAALGIAAPAADEGLVLDVSCNGQAFARYVAQGNRLLSVAEGYLFELQPAAMVAAAKQAAMATAAAVPAAAATPAPMQAKPAPARKAPKQAQSAKPAMNGGALYLASYRSQDGAQKGWTVLQRQAAGLKGLQPVFKEIDLGAKGRFIRLYAAGADSGARADICAALKTASPDCGARY